MAPSGVVSAEVPLRNCSLTVIGCRAAQLQALQASTNYYQQTPLQQTGFYQAQQTGSTLQVNRPTVVTDVVSTSRRDKVNESDGRRKVGGNKKSTESHRNENR